MVHVGATVAIQATAGVEETVEEVMGLVKGYAVILVVIAGMLIVVAVVGFVEIGFVEVARYAVSWKVDAFGAFVACIELVGRMAEQIVVEGTGIVVFVVVVVVGRHTVGSKEFVVDPFGCVQAG